MGIILITMLVFLLATPFAVLFAGIVIYKERKQAGL